MSRSNSPSRTSQQGMILFISLIVLVALALAALAMFRGSMGTTLVATNVASRQASLSLADNGVQLAAVDLQNRAVGATYNNDQVTMGYFSAIPQPEPDWVDEANWQCNVDTRCLTPAEDLRRRRRVHQQHHRLHRALQDSPHVHGGQHRPCRDEHHHGQREPVRQDDHDRPRQAGREPGGGRLPDSGRTMLYFRITTRVDGPRNSRTVTQTVVSLQT